MLHDIAFAFWFLLPAAIANAAPVFGNLVPGFKNWQTQLDFGKHFRGKKIFGTHKTWRGLVSGIVVATVILWVQHLLVRQFGWASSLVSGVDYIHYPAYLLGPLFGIGALGGDAIESFFKRQRGIPSGGRWIPFDQLDYIAGEVLITLPFVVLSIRQYIWIAVVWFLVHIISSYIGWHLGIKEQPI